LLGGHGFFLSTLVRVLYWPEYVSNLFASYVAKPIK